MSEIVVIYDHQCIMYSGIQRHLEEHRDEVGDAIQAVAVAFDDYDKVILSVRVEFDEQDDTIEKKAQKVGRALDCFPVECC